MTYKCVLFVSLNAVCRYLDISKYLVPTLQTNTNTATTTIRLFNFS